PRQPPRPTLFPYTTLFRSPERHPLLAPIQDDLAHEPALPALVGRLHERGEVAPGALGEQRLVVPRRGALEDVVGEVEDGLRRAVVPLQLVDARAGEGVGEAEDVADVGAAEAVDALGVVADGHHVAV